MLVPGPWCIFSGPVTPQDFQVLLPHNLSNKLACFPCSYLDMRIPKSGPKSSFPGSHVVGTGTTCVRLLATFVRLLALELQHPIAGGSELSGCSGTSQ